MKKILLLSDTRSHIDDVILKYVNQADEVWHAGDIGNLEVTDTIKELKPLRAVYGNIDDEKARLEFPLNNRFSVMALMFGLRILVVIPTNTIKQSEPKSQKILRNYSFVVIPTF